MEVEEVKHRLTRDCIVKNARVSGDQGRDMART